MTMVSSVLRALAELPQDAKSGPVVELALRYAGEIDRASAVADDTNDVLVALAAEKGAAALLAFGPKLAAVLDALLLTPRARAVALRGEPDAPGNGPSPADELRARRAARTN